MQKAITLHPNQNSILIKEQKRIIATLNSIGGLVFPLYPLWIFLKNKEFEKHSPKEIAAAIESLKIESPFFRDNKLIFPVRITLCNDTHITEELAAATAKKIPLDCTITSIAGDFSMECKIFKISEATHDESSHSYALWNSIWHKTRQLASANA